MPKALLTGISGQDGSLLQQYFAYDPGFTGGLTVARHDVIPESDKRTQVRQQLDQRGPLGALVGLLMRGMTRRYLDLEAAGLKTRSEQRRVDGPTA